jgi:hypothetical protein
VNEGIEGTTIVETMIDSRGASSRGASSRIVGRGLEISRFSREREDA